MTEIYCGVGKPKKKQRLGTMKECAEKGQIRLYGLRKIDSKIIKSQPTKKVSVAAKNNLLDRYGRLGAKIKKVKTNIEYEKDKKVVKELKKELEKLTEEIEQVKSKLKTMMRASRRKKSRSKSRSRKRTR